MRILDLDLDFFLNKKHCGVVTNINRLSENDFQPDSNEHFIDFLENRCGLSELRKIRGKVFVHHDEVFYFLRKLQEQRNFELTFEIDHVDAHADIGFGDSSHFYISSEILALPLSQRPYPDKINGWEGLSPGNYLSFAIACRWITSLKYITKPEWANDISWFHFRNFDVTTNIIELKRFNSYQIESIKSFPIAERVASFQPIEIEPEVPFSIEDSNNFESDGNYDYIFLTQSPGFTPLTSDRLIPIFNRYIIEC